MPRSALGVLSERSWVGQGGEDVSEMSGLNPDAIKESEKKLEISQ